MNKFSNSAKARGNRLWLAVPKSQQAWLPFAQGHCGISRGTGMHQPCLPRTCWSFFFSSGWHRWPLKLAGCVSGGCGSGDADFSRHGPDVIFEAENTQAKSFWAPSLGPPFRRQVSVCRGANLDGSYLQIWTGLRSSSEPPSPSWGQVFRMRLMPGQSKSFQLSTVMVKCERTSAAGVQHPRAAVMPGGASAMQNRDWFSAAAGLLPSGRALRSRRVSWVSAAHSHDSACP